ncbi:MAG: hypothetical protein PHR66_02515 [Desulfuromonadaceae bacterium]|nr:hypothetical protein [Desulfuromonadaceae bacterium]
MSIDGLYEIVEMELWDKDAIDLVEPGYIHIRGKKGKLHFICVDGQMEIQKSKDRYLFTWEGNDECDPASGYGNYTCSNDTLTGRIYIHGSDDSSFVAIKVPTVNRLPKMVDRGVLVVKAKEPFREWLSLLPGSDHLTIKEINDDCTAYLIPGFENDHERDHILKKVYSDVFVEQLVKRCIDEDRWPQKRTLTLFKRWFELEFHSVVEELVEDELYTEEK